MKELSEDKVLSFPGFEKILEPFIDSGTARVKDDLIEPEEDEHFSANTNVTEIPEPAGPIDSKDEKPKNKKKKKARKSIQEGINNLRTDTIMKSKNKFDELFENVMGEGEDIDFGMEAGAFGDDEGADVEISDEMEETHSDIASKIKNAIDALQEIHDELSGGGEGDDEGEEDIDVDIEGEEEIEDADEHNYDEEGMEDSYEAVSQPEPKPLSTNTAHFTNPTANNQMGNIKAAGGHADKGSIPAPETGKEHSPAPAVSKLTATKGSRAVGKGKPGEELFKV